MDVVTILGSPRLTGNTATVLGQVEDRLSHGHRIQRIHVASQNIGGCLGCGKCQETHSETGCVQKDDISGFIEIIMRNDGILLATPLYGWSFSGQLKVFLDRLFCLTKFGDPGTLPFSLIEGKIMALLVTCGGPVAENADIIQTQFDRFAAYTQVVSAGCFIVPGCTTPDRLPVSATATVKQMAIAVTSSG